MRNGHWQLRTYHVRQENRCLCRLTSTISTMDPRPSKRSLLLGLHSGQSSAPGISGRRWLGNWRPLHTPKTNVVSRAKNSFKASGVVQERRGGPPFACTQHVTIRAPTTSGQASEIDKTDVPMRISDLCTSIASKPASVNPQAISIWPLTPCSRRLVTLGPDVYKGKGVLEYLRS